MAMGQSGGDITTGLVNWWKFDEGTGATAADSGSGGNNLTINFNNPASWTTGMIGPYAFVGNSGSAGYAYHTTNYNLSGSFTIAGWFKQSGASNGRGLTLSDTTHGIYVLLTMALSGANALYAVTTNGSDVHGTVSNVGAWNHIAATYSGSTIGTVYVNGAVVSLTSAAGTWGVVTGVAGAMVGAKADHSTVYDDIHDDIRFYNRQLSAADVTSLYAYR